MDEFDFVEKMTKLAKSVRKIHPDTKAIILEDVYQSAKSRISFLVKIDSGQPIDVTKKK